MKAAQADPCALAECAELSHYHKRTDMLGLVTMTKNGCYDWDLSHDTANFWDRFLDGMSDGGGYGAVNGQIALKAHVREWLRYSPEWAYCNPIPPCSLDLEMGAWPNTGGFTVYR